MLAIPESPEYSLRASECVDVSTAAYANPEETEQKGYLHDDGKENV